MENLTKALIEAQKEFAPLAKTAKNPHFKNTFVPLSEVIQNVLPILNKHGLAITQFPSHSDGIPTLTTRLMHESGEVLTGSMPLLAVKNDPQAQGSAITYARRYALMSVLGVVGDEDDDAVKASATAPARPASPLDAAKTRLRTAIKAANADGQQYAWVKEEKNVDKINQEAQALENLAAGGLSGG